MASTRPVALLLSPRPSAVAAARLAGAQPVVVSPGPPVPTDREGAERQVRVDWRDHHRLVSALARLDCVRRSPHAGPVSVFGFTAANALAAARANEALGLAGTPPDAVSTLMDKAALRGRLGGCAGPPVSYVRCGHASLLPFLAELIGYPCVVKPRAGSDGEGVRLIRGPQEAAAAVAAYPEITDLLVEEYLEGPELTVEALSRGGRHHVLGCTRRLPGGDPGLTAVGHQLPVPLDPRTVTAVRQLVAAVLDRTGHRDGPSHTELVLTERGPRLVESQPRPCRGEVAQLLRLAYGTDVLALAVASVLGLPEPLRSPRAPYAGLRYLDLPPGHAGRVPRLSEVRSLPGVVSVRLSVPPGTTVRRLPSGSFHHGYVLAAAASETELNRALDQAVDLLRPALATR
ncbi:ATP-grasp domain-containing protein [Streptomyces sp. NPDC006879]|uniref:ATP-grasp domain-containing protein n=1 Tax=Streptomyces sp. NPDC006879 TaxID=3364767 RepID=UPI00369BC1CC